MKAQSAASREARDEAARLRASGTALRQAADISGAELRPLLDAALAELDGAAEALAGAGGRAAGDLADDRAEGPHTERRLLQAIFQQAPAPLFLLGLDGTVRRATSAAGQLVGSGSGSWTWAWTFVSPRFKRRVSIGFGGALSAVPTGVPVRITSPAARSWNRVSDCSACTGVYSMSPSTTMS